MSHCQIWSNGALTSHQGTLRWDHKIHYIGSLTSHRKTLRWKHQIWYVDGLTSCWETLWWDHRILSEGVMTSRCWTLRWDHQIWFDGFLTSLYIFEMGLLDQYDNTLRDDPYYIRRQFYCCDLPYYGLICVRFCFMHSYWCYFIIIIKGEADPMRVRLSVTRTNCHESLKIRCYPLAYFISFNIILWWCCDFYGLLSRVLTCMEKQVYFHLFF